MPAAQPEVAQPTAEFEAPEVAETQELTAAPEIAETPAVDPGRPKRYKK